IGSIPVDVNDLGVDLLSLSGHKIYGPKGVGVLYVKTGTKISPFIHGGGQERGKRAGTENVANIVGIGKAIELATQDIQTHSSHLQELRDMTIEEILKAIPHSRLNGHKEKRLPGNVNISFEYIEGESILLMLDSKGVCASSGSACTSGSLDPSHVLLAIGLPHEIAHGSLRLTFGEENTKDDVKYLLEILPPIIEKLRAMSPLYNQK
ncbi:MAG: Cysteine desulfurase, partial [candidate division WS6 bacterium GW2011_GWF1_35_23]